MKKLLTFAAALPFALAIIAPVFIARSFAVMMLWNWFVHPLGVISIGFWWAYGLQSLFLVLRFDMSWVGRGEGLSLRQYIFGIANPIAAICVGWLVVSLGGLS